MKMHLFRSKPNLVASDTQARSECAYLLKPKGILTYFFASSDQLFCEIALDGRYEDTVLKISYLLLDKSLEYISVCRSVTLAFTQRDHKIENYKFTEN